MTWSCLSIGCTILLLTVVLCGTAIAQQVAVTGVVEDSLGNALSQATIVVLMRGDSTMVGFSTSNDAGRFIVRRLLTGEYILQVSYVGHETILRDFDVQDIDVDLSSVVLPVHAKELEEFVVTGRRLPYVVRGDTIEYNALAALIRPQDMVEDLLRRLPGIDVDRSGTITAQGETVENVLVEGKEFFGDDHTIATRNLPADAVDKVEVYDKPSDRAELTGVPDGQEKKTINLGLTEEAKRGAFGQITGGFGGEQFDHARYFGKGSLFRFASKTQLALIGSAENMNQPGFSNDQLSSFLGAAALLSSLDAAEGFSESLGVGFNANRDIGEHTTINTSYFLTDLDKLQESVVLRQQLLGSAVSASSDRSGYLKTGNLVHTVTLNAEIRLAEGHDMVLRGNLSKASSSRDDDQQEETAEVSRGLQNRFSSTIKDDADVMSGNMHLIWRKRISESGRSLIAIGDITARDAVETRNLYSKTKIYDLGDLQTREELHQEQELQEDQLRQVQRLELLQPVGGTRFTFFAEHTGTHRTQDKKYFDIVDGPNLLNRELGRGFNQNDRYLRSGARFSLTAKDNSWWINGDVTAQFARRRGMIANVEQGILNEHVYVLPSIWANWDWNESSDVLVWYMTNTREPSIWQLQPFTDNSNPLRIYSGNPELTPEYWHNLKIQYHWSGNHSEKHLWVNAGATLIQNSIVRVLTVDQDLRQRISSMNAGVTRVMDVSLLFSFPLYFLNMEWSVSNDFDVEKGREFINGEENINQLLRNRVRFSIDYYHNDQVEITAGSRVTWNRARYSLNEDLNRNYINSVFDMEVYWHPDDNWSITSTLLYRVFDRDLFDTSQDVGLLNVSVSRLFFEGRWNFQLQLNDVLNQNQGVSISTAPTYIQESRIVSLGRHLMLKFTYKPKLM